MSLLRPLVLSLTLNLRRGTSWLSALSDSNSRGCDSDCDISRALWHNSFRWGGADLILDRCGGRPNGCRRRGRDTDNWRWIRWRSWSLNILNRCGHNCLIRTERDILARTAASLVERDCASATTELVLVTTAWHEAISHKTVDWRAIQWDGVAAVAFGRVFGASDVEATGGAEVDALLVCHVLLLEASAGEGAATDVILATADVLEFLGRGKIDKWVGWWRDGSCSIASRWLNSIGALTRRWIAAWELGESALSLLIDGRWNLAGIGEVVVVKLEDWTVLDVTGVRSTLRNSPLKKGDIPTINEVAVKPVTSLVTVGEDEWLLAVDELWVETVGIPSDLVEEGDEALRMRSWALSGVDTVWVGHVRLVVWAIEVLSVPAGWEEDLRTDTVLAVALWEVVGLWSAFAETGVVDGALLESGGE